MKKKLFYCLFYVFCVASPTVLAATGDNFDPKQAETIPLQVKKQSDLMILLPDDEVEKELILNAHQQSDSSKTTLLNFGKPADDVEGVLLKNSLNFKNIPTKDKIYWNLAWHAKLADYGDQDSQFLIAKAYETGNQVALNYDKAVSFYKMAAQNGHLEACMRLGQIFETGAFGKKSLDEALSWYERGATLGYVPAQMKTARLYEDKKEYQTAYHWLETAMKQLFPHYQTLTDMSPELERLAKLAGIVVSKTPNNIDTTVPVFETTLPMIETVPVVITETSDKPDIISTEPVLEVIDVSDEVDIGIRPLSPKIKKSFFGASMRD